VEHHNLEAALEKAGDATEAPPPPKGGIPPQRLPGFIRWPIRTFFLPFLWLDIAMQRVARAIVRPPYKQAGKCLKRGNCCHYIMMRKPRGPLGVIFQLWNTEVNGFYLRSQEPHEYEGHRVSVMGCRYLQKDGSCKHYAFRPMVCRKWPVIAHFGHPRMLKGCGFRAIPRDGKGTFPD